MSCYQEMRKEGYTIQDERKFIASLGSECATGWTRERYLSEYLACAARRKRWGGRYGFAEVEEMVNAELRKI